MTVCDLLLRSISRSETDPGSQEDNAPCHESARANKWKRDNSIGTYDGQPKVQISTLLKMFGKPLKKHAYLRLKTPMIWSALCKKFWLLCLSPTYKVLMLVFPKECHTCPRTNNKILEEKVSIVYCWCWKLSFFEWTPFVYVDDATQSWPTTVFYSGELKISRQRPTAIKT